MQIHAYPFSALGCATSSHPHLCDPPAEAKLPAVRGVMHIPPRLIIFFLAVVWVVHLSGPIALWQVTDLQFITCETDVAAVTNSRTRSLPFPSQKDQQGESRVTYTILHNQLLAGLVHPSDPIMTRCSV